MVRRFLASVCLLSLLPALPGLCQSLADLAKKEREKQQGKPRKVYTNDDLNKYEDLRSACRQRQPLSRLTARLNPPRPC